MEKIFNDTNSVFEKFRKTPRTEFEFRFGKISGKTFDTNVGQATFEKVLRRLKKYQGWESMKKSRDTVYQADQGLRLTIDEDTGNQFQITKKKLYKSDFSIQGKPFDVRFSVSSENPVVDIPDVEYNRVRQRTRESFIRKNVVIDMTIVSGDPNDLDSENDVEYQIEIEIFDPQEVDNFYNVVYKIQNILDIIE
jgi:hypothetical protein